jgi:hypothetical protein
LKGTSLHAKTLISKGLSLFLKNPFKRGWSIFIDIFMKCKAIDFGLSILN